MGTRNGWPYFRAIFLCLAAQVMAPPASTAPLGCDCGVPIVEYRFNETGTTAPSTGTDTTALTFKNSDNGDVDLHGAAGSGVSGQAGDFAFDNSNPTPPSVPGDVGMGGYGGRAEQAIDDDNLDGFASFTFQGWFKSSDPASVTGNGATLFAKTDPVTQAQGGGGYSAGWSVGMLSMYGRSETGEGSADSSQQYFSGSQWIFFAVTYDGTLSSDNVKFYQGTSSVSVQLTNTFTIDIGTLRGATAQAVFGNSPNVIRSFLGLLDNLRIFGSYTDGSGALSAAQLEAWRIADAGDDWTPPVVAPTVTGTAGNAGWYVSDVQVEWSETDGESTISSSTGCETTHVTSDTPGQDVTCSATSAGGTSTETVTIKRDATPPTATATASPPPNANGWRKTNVNVSFSGTDAMSGGVTCDPQVVLSTEGLNQSVSGSCHDAAGISAQATADGISIDKTAPTISITSPVNAANYSRNQFPPVRASFSCDDPLSGVASCVGTVADGQPINTAKKAKNAKFTVTATDRAGNTKKQTVTYSVN